MNSGAQSRIGVVGGTFDPPHFGHFELVRTVLDSGLIDVALLVPCLRHPFGKTPVAFEHRLAMCRILCATMKGAEVTDIETRIEHPGRTLSLVEALECERRGSSLRLVAGADIYFEREKWYRFDEVERRAPPIYVSRQGAPPLPFPSLPAPSLVSSSAVREALSRGEDPRSVLPTGVAEYVLRHRLYGVGA